MLGSLFRFGTVQTNSRDDQVSLAAQNSENTSNVVKAAIYCMTPVAGVVSGLLAYGVGTGLEGASGLASWKWLFIIEGAATIGFGGVVLLLLPGLPETVAQHGTWLFKHEDERHIILLRAKASEFPSSKATVPN